MALVDRETFDRLADEYPTASWAVWSDGFPDEGCIEDDPTAMYDFLATSQQRGRLQPSVVFLGLNPSGKIVAPLWNFHGVGRNGLGGGNDHRLKEYIQDGGLSALTGGYMTDVSLIQEPDADNVTTTTADSERFADQLRLLDQDRYTVVCFGNKAFDALRRSIGIRATTGPVSLRTFTATVADRPIRTYRVWHYANHWNPEKYPELRAQLAYIAGVRSDETDETIH